MSTFEVAVHHDQYELAALRLVLGVAQAIDAAAPAVREELVSLLSFEAPAAARRTSNTDAPRAQRGRGRGGLAEDASAERT